MQAGGAEGPTLGSGARAAYDHLAGSASALSVTAAMLVFFWSGEVYLRAWARGFPPDARLNRRGDLLSGWGALLLGLGLFLIGQPVLAATAGLLHAIGKFGSTLHGPLPLRPGAAGPLPDRGAAQSGSGAGDAGRRVGFGAFGARAGRWRPRWRRRRC